jgi:hypothetical protein
LDVCSVLTAQNVRTARCLSAAASRAPHDFQRVLRQSAEIELFGRRCRVISLDDLILAKEALGREKDLLAAKELRAIREKTK